MESGDKVLLRKDCHFNILIFFLPLHLKKHEYLEVRNLAELIIDSLGGISFPRNTLLIPFVSLFLSVVIQIFAHLLLTVFTYLSSMSKTCARH